LCVALVITLIPFHLPLNYKRDSAYLSVTIYRVKRLSALRSNRYNETEII